MFLFATLGFIVVQLDRQRKQRAQQVTGSRTEYLRYLANVRKVAREAADQQRRALTWHHPDPTALPALAEERSRVWEHGIGRPRLPPRPVRRVRAAARRWSWCRRRARPIDQVDPAAASALHRLLVVHRLQPDLPAVDRPARLRPDRGLRPRGAGPLAGPVADLLGDGVPLPRAPRRRRAQLRAEPRPLGLGEVAAARPERPAVRRRRPDADGVDLAGRPGRRCCPPTWPSGPRFGADERPATPHLLLVIDGGELPPGNHVVPPDGLHGVTVLDLPARWDELEDATRLRLQFEDEPRRRRRPARRCTRCGCARSRSGPAPTSATGRDRRGVRPPARRRCTPSRRRRRAASGEIAGPTDFMELLGPRRRAHLRPRRAPGARARRATGCGCRSGSARAARWSTSTSRSPPSRAWARTAW